MLRCKPPGKTEELPLPLKRTDVKATIAAYIASVHVTQRYHNPYNAKIEAVYVFPLPQDAAVNEFVMTIGKRHIRGIIREREEAEQLYLEARRQGYVASLLTQERPNIFTQSVANIEPGKAIDIELTYFSPLRYQDGEYEFVFPTVVGPRFNPPGSTKGVGAVGRGKHGESGQQTEVQYLRPTERSGHDIALSVDVDAGVTIESLASPSHAIETTTLSPSRRRVQLSRLDTIPNKDFVLRYKVAGDGVKSGLLVHRDQRGGYFTLMLQPPAELSALPRAPLELIFVLDCSGSMSGTPLALAKAAVERALKRLGPDDTFQVVRFSDQASQLGAHPVPATPDNVARGLDYLAQLNSEGGTLMIEGIKAALDYTHDRRRLRVVSFLTDGYIGNEAEILGEIHKRLGSTRIFSFGVGSSTNRYLLERMAVLGNGAVAYVGLDEGAARAVDGFYERIAHPALTNLRVDWGALEVADVYPSRLPDLFIGRPVVVTGRFAGRKPTRVVITGRTGTQTREITLPVDPTDSGTQHAAIASVWARLKIADLEDRATYADADELGGQIKTVALEYGLMSAYTAFVAVDSSTRTAGTRGTTVVQPVPVPEGVSYDTTVTEGPPR
jgi:Ca-activated chloride channel family protein